MKLIDDVYSYVWSKPSNGCNTYVFRYFVDGRPRYLVIDPGQRQVLTPATASGRGGLSGYFEDPALEALVADMAADGISADEIGLVACTHCHTDHCEAAPELKRQSGAMVAIHERDREAYLRTLGEWYGGENGLSQQQMEPDIYLDEGELLLGKPNPIALRIIHTPGHSPGSISIYWPENRVLAVGDVVFYRNVGRTDFPGGDARALRASVAKLAELDVEHLLTGHPYGHPGVITGRGDVESNFRFILAYVLRS